MTEQTFDNITAVGRSPRIAILDETTSNQIAAGEVIERPASVVKELVENAIDAGASRITIELSQSGKRLIKVTDDGSGMSQEDAILSLQRHATSKIRTAADLEEIITMGFRGEALPSIASVSRTQIISCVSDSNGNESGTCVEIVGGDIVNVGEIGARGGTSITVEDLFYNVPARLKFLKTDSTELHNCAELIQRMALARPDVAFRLIHDGADTFSSPGSGSLADVCVQVYGRSIARQLLAIDYDSGMGVHVTGMLGPPETMRGSRAGQHCFVNRRFVRDRTIGRALDDGYRAVQTIHGQRYPVGVIMVDVEPANVDVNVSPTKTEVRFLREREVFSAVYRAIQQTLITQGGLAPSVDMRPVGAPKSDTATPQSPEQYSWQSVFERKAITSPFTDNGLLDDSLAPPLSEPIVDPFADTPAPRFLPNQPVSARLDRFAPSTEVPTLTPRPIDQPEHRTSLVGMRVLAQTRNMYILAQTDHALLLIDQHIAHERILYERLIKGQSARALTIQHLIVPISLELGRREAFMVEQRLEELAKAGFALEPFGDGTYLLRSAPAIVAQKQSPEIVIREIIDELLEKTVSRHLVVPAEEVLITASCKMAVKAGDPLTFPEMQGLMDELLACDNPYTCPHGRPVIIELANNDLDRKFGRI